MRIIHHRCQLFLLTFSLFVSLGAGTALADVHVSADLSLGMTVFGDDHTSYDGGAPFDLGVTLTFAERYELHTALGVMPTVDRHSITLLPRLRVEGTHRWRLGRFEPALGLGAMLWPLGPSAHGVATAGVRLSPAWSLALDARGGALWDLSFHRPGTTPFGEGLVRVSWTFR